VDHKNG